MKVSAYGSSLTGSSGINGDVFHISPDKKVFLLADGASGAGSEGKVLMGKTCLELVRQFDYTSSGLDAKEYVNELFWKINNRLIVISQELGNLIFGTIDIAVYDKGILTVTTLGDSPAFYFNGVVSKRIAKNRKKYEDMIDDGYITREQYEGYIRKMHERMWCCFDYFIPEIVPNNVIEQYEVRPGDILVFCCDGLSDWLSEEKIFSTLTEYGLKNGTDILANEAKEISLKDHKGFDDITIVAAEWTEQI